MHNAKINTTRRSIYSRAVVVVFAGAVAVVADAHRVPAAAAAVATTMQWGGSVPSPHICTSI